MSASNPTALIAEDEPLLAQSLQTELARAWPALRIVATVGDGISAVQHAIELQPDVLFFDIRMPGMNGLDAAAELLEQWPDPANNGAAFPALVFVTAYDQYAVQAFEAQALDYLLKPLQPGRLQKTVEKLQSALARPTSPGLQLDTTLAQLRGLLGASVARTGALLQVIQASAATGHGASLHMVPITTVLCFEAADKYLRVLTAGREYLIRTPLKELQEQLDPNVFWQIHRGTVVCAQAIETVTRDEAGKTHLSLHGLSERFVVSRLYAHRFKAM